MRDNIVVKNMEETKGENAQQIEEKLVKLFKESLQIKAEDMKQVEIQRAHRVGKYANTRTRNIVAKLNTKGKGIVLAHLNNINKSSKIKIVEQYPQEIHSNRNKLWQVYVEAKQNGKQASWTQDRLHIDGRTINPPKDKNTDINLDTTSAATKLKVKHTAIMTKDSTHLQAHIVNVTSRDDVIPALKAIRADIRVAQASFCSYAYRIGTEQQNVHNYDDDENWGKGKCIMESIARPNVYNKLICVSMWSTGKRASNPRSEAIQDIIGNALQPS